MDLKALLPVVVQISLILIVASIGLRSHWGDLLYAFKRPGLLLRGFAAVYIAVPLFAILLVLLLPMEPIVKIGIVAMAVSPLAPFAPGKMLKAGAETRYVTGLYIGLLLLAIVVVPLTLVLLTVLFPRAVAIGPIPIAWFIAKSVLLPLAGGMIVEGLFPSAAPRLAKLSALVANIALAIVFLLFLFKSGHQIVALIGDGALLVIVVATVAGLIAGHLLGGPEPRHRMALAEAAATRHPGIAGLLVHGHVNDQRAMLAVVLYLVVSLIVSALYFKWARKSLSPVVDPDASGAVA